MYRTFLADMKVINPHVRVIGLTATPFRLKGGLIRPSGSRAGSSASRRTS